MVFDGTTHWHSFSQNFEIWLGGLFTPEAYITATRQYVAQANNWSLEELYLDVSLCLYSDMCDYIYMCTCMYYFCKCVWCIKVTVDVKGKLGDCNFGVTGM